MLQVDGLDPQTRQTGEHVDFESLRWWFAFRMTIQLFPVTKVLLNQVGALWVAADRDRVLLPLISDFVDRWARNAPDSEVRVSCT